MCDVVEIGGSADHLAPSIRVPETQHVIEFNNWPRVDLQKHKVFDKTFMFKTVFVCMFLRKNLRCVSVNVSVTTIGELCDGVLAD